VKGSGRISNLGSKSTTHEQKGKKVDFVQERNQLCLKGLASRKQKSLKMPFVK